MTWGLYTNGPGMGLELRVETRRRSLTVDVVWATLPVSSVVCAKRLVPKRMRLYRAPAGNGRGLLAVWAPRGEVAA